MSADESSRPNILFLMADQQQWQTIAGRSLCRTPSIQRLVDSGLLFNRSYTPSTLCCPARAMLLSGAYHWHNGVFNQVHSAPSVHRDLWPGIVTYPQRLKEAGYYVGHVGKWHASYVRTPLDFGFDEVAAISCNRKLLDVLPMRPEDSPRQKPNPEYTKLSERLFQWPGSDPFPLWVCLEGDESKTNAAWIADAGIRMMERASHKGTPWHIEIHWPEPHDVYAPLKKYVDRYKADDIPVPPSFYDTFGRKPGLHKRESSIWEPLTTRDVQEGLAHYFAYCEQLDHQIGRVLDALEQTGNADNTIVVFTSDHGDMGGSHRMWIKDRVPYEECYRIPLVIRWPGRIEPGAATDHLVQLHDLGHTYLDILGLEPLPFADGRSLVPLFDDPYSNDWDDTILCAHYGGEFLDTQRMVITQRYKYIFNGFDFDEVYDLQEDPHEMRNVVEEPAYSQVVDELRLKLYDLMTRHGDPYGDDSPAYTGDFQGNGDRPNRYGAPRYLIRPHRS